MSTLKTTNLQHASAASPAIVLAADGTAAAQVSSLNDGPLSGARNRIINGDMRIDQRNAGASVTITNNDTYTLDRWSTGQPGASPSKLSIQQSTTAPAGFNNSLLVTSLTALSLSAGDFFSVYQHLEGYNVSDLAFGSASAKSITLSFWVRSSLTGTFGGAIQNSARDRSYPFTYSISAANTWEQKAITIPGDTSGTWNTGNGKGISVALGLAVGSTFSGTAGAWAGANYWSATGATQVLATNGATFYITGVQLEAGTVATPFERRSFGQELALCHRYCYAWGTKGPEMAAQSGRGMYSDANQFSLMPFGDGITNLRAIPSTVTAVGTQGTDWAIQSSAGVNQTGFTLVTSIGQIGASKTSHGQTAVNLQTLTSNGRIIVSSEL